MKKFMNKLSSSGKMDVEAQSHFNEEYSDTHVRKSSALPADTRDNSLDIKLKKSFSGSGSIGKSSSPKVHKDKDEKEKLNESDDKSLRKSGSTRKKSISKSTEVKPESMKSPSLKSIFASSYGQQRDTVVLVESEESSDEEFVPRSRGNSMPDDEERLSTAPLRVPSAPGRIGTSPVPAGSTPPRAVARATSPRVDSPHSAFTPYSPSTQTMAYSPPASPYQPAPSPSSLVPSSSPRSLSTPSPVKKSPSIVNTDEFELRFGMPLAHADAVSDKTTLGAGLHDATEPASEDVDMDDDNDDGNDDGELMNQKGKSSGLFSRNKAKKLK